MLPCGKSVCNECISILTNIKEPYFQKSSFQCTLCDDHHLIPVKGFPLNESLIKLIEKKPKKVYRGNVVEELELHLEAIYTKKEHMKFQLNNGVDIIKEYCMDLRCKIFACAESAILRINQLTDSMISEIEKYENESINSYQEKLSVERRIFDEKIDKMDHFHMEWTTYLKNVPIEEQLVKKENKSALLIEDNADEDTIKIKHFIFNDWFLEFETNQIFEENNFGSLQYKNDNYFCSKIFALPTESTLADKNNKKEIKKKQSIRKVLNYLNNQC